MYSSQEWWLDWQPVPHNHISSLIPYILAAVVDMQSSHGSHGFYTNMLLLMFVDVDGEAQPSDSIEYPRRVVV